MTAADLWHAIGFTALVLFAMHGMNDAVDRYARWAQRKRKSRS